MAKKSNTKHYTFSAEAEALLVTVRALHIGGINKKGVRTRPEGVRCLYTPTLDIELLRILQPYAEAFGMGNTETQKELSEKIRIEFGTKTGEDRSVDSVFYRIHKLLKQGVLADLNYRSSMFK